MLQHGAGILERQRPLECVVIDEDIGSHDKIESVCLVQIDALENDIEVYRLTCEHYVRTDSHRARFQALPAVDRLKYLRRPNGRDLESHPVAQRTPVSDEIGRPRIRELARQLDDITGIHPGASASALDVIDHSGADVQNRHGYSVGSGQTQPEERIVQRKGLQSLLRIVVVAKRLVLIAK